MNPTEGPIAVIQRFYAAEADYMQAGGPAGGAGFTAIAATLAADVVLHHTPDLPWGGDWHGHDGFQGWAQKMSELNQSVQVEAPRYFPDADTLLVSLTLITVARKTGIRVKAPMIQQVQVHDGRIVDFRAFYWNVPGYLNSYGLSHLVASQQGDDRDS